MASTPPNGISDSWVDVTGQSSPIFPPSPSRVATASFGTELDYIRLLQEAQRDSNRSSMKVSPISSALMSINSTCRNTPTLSPKSPPNSPNPELSAPNEDLKDVYINTLSGCERGQDLLCDWESQPNLPKDPCGSCILARHAIRSRKSSSGSSASPQVKFHNECQMIEDSGSSSSSTKGKKKRRQTSSKNMILTLIITNIISVLIGAGVGMWLSKRGGSATTKVLLPITI